MARATFSHQERSGRVESECCSGCKGMTVKFVPNIAIIRDEAESENHLSSTLIVRSSTHTDWERDATFCRSASSAGTLQLA